MSDKNKPIITVDIEKYEHFLEESDWSDEQKAEFLQALWNITFEFVSLGFGVHPLQQIENDCGERSENSYDDTILSPDVLNSLQQPLSTDFKDQSELEKQPQNTGVE